VELHWTAVTKPFSAARGRVDVPVLVRSNRHGLIDLEAVFL